MLDLRNTSVASSERVVQLGSPVCGLGKGQWLPVMAEGRPKMIPGMAYGFYHRIQGPEELKQVRRPNSG